MQWTSDELLASLQKRPSPNAYRKFMDDLRNPKYKRAAMLPMAVNTETGKREMALPSIFVDMLEAAMLPGDVYQGNVSMYGEDGRTNPQVINRSADLAGMMTLGSGAIPAEANSLRMGIKAYHGSPHDFDRFDMSKIGTGEGAQAYGHGLYFAENEDVARGYQRKLSFPAGGGDDILAKVADDVNYYGGNVDATRLAYEQGIKSPNPEAAAMYRAKLEALPAAEAKYKGRMYEVNIDANPDDFLDWDKPLTEQSQSVLDAIAKTDATLATKAPSISIIKDPEIRSGASRALGQNDGNVQGLEMTIDNDAALYNAVTNYAKRNKIDLDEQDMRPSDYVYQQAKEYLDALNNSQSTTGDALGRILGVKGADMMQAGPAAARLREAGIPGIKYFDARSRAADDGSRNYVVFDDKLISIVKKYGVAALVSAGVLSQAQGEEMKAQGYY
jgi:hypothetical protein